MDVTTELTSDQRRRAAHRSPRDGGCPRCGLHVTHNHGICPPGFWMSETELAAWERGGFEGVKGVGAP